MTINLGTECLDNAGATLSVVVAVLFLLSAK